MSSTKSKPSSPGLWERIGPSAFAGSRFHPYRIGAVVAGVAVAISAATFLGNASQDEGPTTKPVASGSVPAPTASAQQTPSAAPQTAGEKFQTEVFLDFAPLNGIVINYQQALQNWDKGKVTDVELKGLFDLGAARFAEARDSLAKRASFAPAPRAIEDYRLVAQLFLESARVGQSAVQVPAGPLRTELRKQVNRLRNLGDRTFDQAKAEVAAVGPKADIDPGLQLRRGAEVPDFPFLGLTPGGPLDTAAPKPATQREFDEDKPEQPFAAWADAVRAAPTADELAAAVSGGSAPALQALSRRLTSTADALFTTPDPQGERLVSVRVQLGLLVGAEAGRAAQASTLVTGITRSALRTSAQRLALLSDLLWDPRLGERDSGFPKSLLTAA